MALFKVKTRRFLRLTGACAWREFYEPFFNRSQILQLIIALVGTWIILQTSDSAEAYNQVSGWIAGAQALGIVLVGWAAISLARAPFLVRRDDRAKGSWRGNTFVFNEPQNVFTRLYFANGLTNTDEIHMRGVEPGAYVTFSVDWEPPHTDKISVTVTPFKPLGLPELSEARHGGRGGCVVRKDGTVSLMARLKDGTAETIVRVYAHSFDLREEVTW